nr:hypothetical protein [Tanacetum cinerariifolium]
MFAKNWEAPRTPSKKNKTYVWGEEQEEAFQILKDKLCNAPVLDYVLMQKEIFGDYDCEIRYHPGKANVVADALSRKDMIKPKRVQEMNMTIQSSIKDRILVAQSEAFEVVDAPAEMLLGLDKQMQRRSDGAWYYLERRWVPLTGDVRTLIMDEAHKSKYSIHIGADKMYYNLRDMSWWLGIKKDITLYSMQEALGTRLDMSTPCHPHTDSQSEHTIQTLEDMLRACIMDFRESWDEKVSFTNHMAEVGEGKLTRPKIVQETTEKILQIKDRLRVACDHQKSYAVKRRKPLELSVAYRLRLPEELNGVHDTFHVSNLKKCLADPTLHVPLEEIQVDSKLNFVEEPVEILEREFKKLKRGRIPIVKVFCSSYDLNFDVVAAAVMEVKEESALLIWHINQVSHLSISHNMQIQKKNQDAELGIIS